MIARALAGAVSSAGTCSRDGTAVHHRAWARAGSSRRRCLSDHGLAFPGPRPPCHPSLTRARPRTGMCSSEHRRAATAPLDDAPRVTGMRSSRHPEVLLRSRPGAGRITLPERLRGPDLVAVRSAASLGTPRLGPRDVCADTRRSRGGHDGTAVRAIPTGGAPSRGPALSRPSRRRADERQNRAARQGGPAHVPAHAGLAERSYVRSKITSRFRERMRCQEHRHRVPRRSLQA